MAYGRWAFVAFAFYVGLTVSSLGLFGPAAVLPYLHDKYGWSISLISAAVSAHFLVSALFVAVMPEIHGLLGVRGTAITGSVSVYLGFIAWALCPLPGLLFLTAIVSGFGLACGSLATMSAIVSLGFATDRAKALGIALNGTAVGGVLLLPLLSLEAERFGLQWTLATLGLLAFVPLLAMSKVIDRVGTGPHETQAGKSPPLGLGNLPLLPPLIAQKEFEESEFALVVATVSAINQIVLAFGPVFFGTLYELTDTYSVPFMIGAMLYVVASATVLQHAHPRRHRS